MGHRIIDLTLPYYAGMRGVSIEPDRIMERDGVNTTDVRLNTHAGTHLDAPVHFVAGARTIDQVDLNKCLGPALVLDLTHVGKGGVFDVQDLEPYAKRIHVGSRLLLRTDWDKHAGLPDYREDHPYVTLEAARWLVDKGVWLLGLDSPSAGPLPIRDLLSATHQVLLGAEIVIVESLANLRQIQQDEVFFVALPLKMQQLDGSPVRAVAVEGITDLP